MNSKLLIVTSISFAITFGACSTAKIRVMPGADGVNRVVVRDIEKDNADEHAVKAAHEYCEKSKKTAIFVQEKSQYKGSMDENTRNTVRKASTAATVLGGFNSPFQKAGQAGHMMTNDRDYESEVVFKCQ